MKILLKLFLSVLLIAFMFQNGIAQSTTAGPGLLGHTGTTTAADWCGWQNNIIPFNIQHRGTLDMNFFTGGNAAAFLRMTIVGSGSPGNAGFVGIGTPAPNQKLTVLNGDINVQTAVRGYRINNRFVLYHKGSITNIFVGVDAGLANTLGFFNTFVGGRAGTANTIGDRNTFVGSDAGLSNLNGNFNTFLGDQAGVSNIGGSSNTFVGHHSGAAYGSGDNNTTLGNHSVFSGSASASGDNNTIVGADAAMAITTGDDNAVLGFNAGNGITTGNQNVLLGPNANVTIPVLSNAIAIGSGTQVATGNSMILGNDLVNVGIGLSGVGLGPANKLEINIPGATTATTPNSLPPGTGFSGLRFRDLTTASTPSPNQFAIPAVLSVDANGDVILVPGTTGALTNANNGTSLDALGTTVQFGNDVGAPGAPAQLLNDRQIPMNNFNLYFTDPVVPGSLTNRMHLGKFSPTFGQFSKFISSNISTDQFRVGGTFTTFYANGFSYASIPLQANPYYFGNISPNYKFGVVALGIDTSDAGRAIGVSGFASAPNGQASVGVSGKVFANNSASNTGVLGRAFGTGQFNYGGQFTSQDGVLNNYGIYASAPSGPGDFAGYFAGDVFTTGGINSGTGYLVASDQMFKTNIDSLSDAINIIKQLVPRKYFYDTANVYNINFSNQQQYGLIAQEVESVLPELVGSITKSAEYDSLGGIAFPAVTYKNLNYDAFIAILMKGIQEQQGKIDSLQSDNSVQDSINDALQSQINTLADAIEACCSSGHVMNTSNSGLTVATDVELRDAQSIVLEQNVPNPFAEQTTINYFLPENVVKAQMLFYNVQGKLIQSVDLNERGKGQLNVFASDLTNGIYTYSLVVDGKIFETKKMVKQ